MVFTCDSFLWNPWVSLFSSRLLDPVVSLSGVLLWFRAVRCNVRSMCLHRHYLVLRCHLGQVLSLVKPTLLPVPACGHSPQEYHLPKKVSSHFLSWLPSFTVTVIVLGVGSCCFTVPRSAWSLRCSSACFCETSLTASRALRPTCCVVIAEFGSAFS